LSRYYKAEIIENLPLNSKTGLLTIKPSEHAPNPEPGQFYMLEVSNSRDPLLKRPFSVFRKTSDAIQFLYEVRGRGTLMLRSLRVGGVINALGPLGNGYPKPDTESIPLVIAGGIGIASLFPLLESLPYRAHIFYGARNNEGLVLLNELKDLPFKLHISTDDGSMGPKGTVVDILNDFLTSQFSVHNSYLIYACGHKAMLEAVCGVALEKGIRGYISAEERMACGMGACLGCAIRAKNKEQKANPTFPPLEKGGEGEFEKGGHRGTANSASTYKMVCKDGPVFPIEEIVW
jgi:dihydroorotate dehydrogenase electron transfer subunit